jgi:hypothetical protein
MIKLGTVFWLVLVSATGFAMFGVKYQVQALEDELARTRRATTAEEHEIHVLDAEWAYLTRPETLDAMNRRFLSLAPISTKQLRTTAADIPMRPPPPAPALVPAPVETVIAIAESHPPGVPPGASEAAPMRIPAPEAANPAAEQPPAQSAPPPSAEKSAALPQPARAAPAKVVARSNPPRRPKSLDELISQIMASR